MIALLKPIAELSTFQEREDACCSELIPAVKSLYNEIDDVDVSGEGGLGSTKETILEQICRYFYGGDSRSHFAHIEENELYTFATLLDPRFKTKAFSMKPCAANAKVALSKHLAKLLETSSQSTSHCSRNFSKAKSLSNFFGRALDGVSDDEELEDFTSAKVSAESIVSAYLQEGRIDPTMDPLEYWQEQERNGLKSLLPQIARKYLSAPIGSVASERLFKVASLITNGTRIRLLPENAEMLVFLKYNLRAVQCRALNLPVPQAKEAQGKGKGSENCDTVDITCD